MIEITMQKTESHRVEEEEDFEQGRQTKFN